MMPVDGRRMIYISAMLLLSLLNAFLIYKSARLIHEVSEAIQDLSTKTAEMESIVAAYHEIMDPIMDKESKRYSFRFEPIEDNNDK